ncbi:MAG: VanZ family protein [Pseudonocardia sp.]|nr:VanZ family protein [Pseudonocardia sp.]
MRRRAPAPRVLALGAACSILVETAQYVLHLDRASSVDDVLVDTAGAGLAALASRRWWRAETGTDEPVSSAAGDGHGRARARYSVLLSTGTQ